MNHKWPSETSAPSWTKSRGGSVRRVKKPGRAQATPTGEALCCWKYRTGATRCPKGIFFTSLFYSHLLNFKQASKIQSNTEIKHNQTKGLFSINMIEQTALLLQSCELWRKLTVWLLSADPELHPKWPQLGPALLTEVKNPKPSSLSWLQMYSHTGGPQINFGCPGKPAGSRDCAQNSWLPV